MMLLQYFRLWRRNGSTFTDLSLDNQDDAVTTLADLSTSEYLYMATLFPFNNFFVWMEVMNAIAATMSLEYYDGSAWRAAVEVLDGTKGLTRSGGVQFTPNKLYALHRVHDTTQSNAPEELAGLTVYNSYWFRVKFSANLSGTAAFKRIGYAFTMSQELKKHDIDIDAHMGAFFDGKADWIPEIMTASEIVASDLKAQDQVLDRGQILVIEDVALACAYKALSLIYFSLGKSQDEKRRSVDSKYEKAMNKRYLSLDQNANAGLDEDEIVATTRYLER
jgi:hypothetical protein